MTAIRVLALLCSPPAVTQVHAPPDSHPEPPMPAVPTDADFFQLLAEQIDSEHDGVGITLGVITHESWRVFRYAKLRLSDPRSQRATPAFKFGSGTYLSAATQPAYGFL